MDLSNPNFISIAQLTAEQARELLEDMRWNGKPVCPHCQSEGTYKIEPKSAQSTTRSGLYKCKTCQKQFTVTVGTIFEGSRIALNKWLLAIFLVCSSKKGISAHQLHRQLKITYKTAWFMCRRIRYAMTQQPLSGMLNGTVEADEVYIGGKEKNKHASKRTKGTAGSQPQDQNPRGRSGGA